MVKKDKIYELKIDEEDDVSGIDSISLVDEPAIEVNWMFFNKTQEHNFEEDAIYTQHLMSVGESEEDLFAEGWVIDSVDYLEGKEDFVTTEPNAPSSGDEKEYKVRYKYILNPRIEGQPAIIETSRPFCKELIRENKVFRIEDIDNAVNDFGQSPRTYRGSWNCRHIWSRIKYRNDATIINKASVNVGKELVGGFPNDLIPDPLSGQPSTITDRTAANPSPSTVRNLGLSKEDFAKISLDYDDTLSTQRGKDLARRLMNEGNDIYIVTRRQSSAGDSVYRTAKELGIDRSKVFFTNGQLKWKKLKELGIQKHYDNNPDEIKAIKDNAPLIRAEKFDYENMESVSDYPDSVKNNAKAVLKWVDENGWGSCGTDVGKQRANQLANGEAISLDTVQRMYSYLSRHAGDLDSSKGYGDGCGKLMYDSWGGKSALSWAESKLKNFGYDVSTIGGYEDPNIKKKKKDQKFSIDSEEKRTIVGPAMIPDLKIFRKDKEGNPYYVYFSADTIKMIAEKYMRNKYLDNNDLNHDGTAVNDVYVIESWIKEDMSDKSVKYGYGDLPVGTWFVSMKCAKTPEGDKVWEMVKNGELAGYSVSGWFEEVASFCREEMFLKKVVEIIKNIK
jgi:hypothetical protein